MHWTTFILVLFFIGGAQLGNLFSSWDLSMSLTSYFFVAKARVRFSKSLYTVLEAPTICVEVINDMPRNEQFSVDFSFSKLKTKFYLAEKPVHIRIVSFFFSC